MTLTESELRFAASALLCAADAYMGLARDSIAYTRIAEQFERQSAEAVALADKITAEIG